MLDGADNVLFLERDNVVACKEDVYKKIEVSDVEMDIADQRPSIRRSSRSSDWSLSFHNFYSQVEAGATSCEHYP